MILLQIREGLKIYARQSLRQKTQPVQREETDGNASKISEKPDSIHLSDESKRLLSLHNGRPKIFDIGKNISDALSDPGNDLLNLKLSILSDTHFLSDEKTSEAGFEDILPSFTGAGEEESFWLAISSVKEGFEDFAEKASKSMTQRELEAMGKTLRSQAMAQIDFLERKVYGKDSHAAALLRSQVDWYYAMWEKDLAEHSADGTLEKTKGLALTGEKGSSSLALPGLMNLMDLMNGITGERKDKFAQKYEEMLDIFKNAVRLEKLKDMEKGGIRPETAEFADSLAKKWDEFMWLLPLPEDDKLYTSSFRFL